MKKEPQGKRGRPSKRSPEVEERIIEGLCAGIPLTQICAPDDMPEPRTVYDWLTVADEFSASFARARAIGFDAIAARLRETARGRGDSSFDVVRDKLIIETDLKLLAKWDPKRYGDRIAQEISGPDGGPVRTSSEITPEMEDRIAAARAKVTDLTPPGSFRGEEIEK